jgi:hypothetical protein
MREPLEVTIAIFGHGNRKTPRQTKAFGHGKTSGSEKTLRHRLSAQLWQSDGGGGVFESPGDVDQTTGFSLMASCLYM